MSHHSSIPPEMNEAFRSLIDAHEKVKDTFPEGKLNKQDEGALALQVGAENGKVVVMFAKPTAWIGFTPEQAVGLAEILIHHAKAAGLRTVVSLTI